MAPPISVLGLTSDALIARANAELPVGRGFARPIFKAAMRQGRFALDLPGMSPASVSAWRAAFEVGLPEVVRVVSETGERGITAKAVLRTGDGFEIECVRIPMANGAATLCISSQVGCKMGCTFCETGLMGLVRNLTAAEIVGQVVVATAVLGWSVKNIVYMGMGEALDNVEAVVQSLKVLNDRRGLGYGQQRFTVCTVGHVSGLERLSALGWRRLNVAVSLNAATDAQRSAIMPINRKTPIAELVAALIAYAPRRNFTLAVNYCLMPGLNDARSDATNTAAICTTIDRAMVNLIPYNPGTSPVTRAPTEHEIERFTSWLEADGAMVRRRTTKGRTVMAACGQLGSGGRQRLPVVG